MAFLKGFASVPLLSDNNTLAISPIGELSNLELTYSKDKKIFSAVDMDTDTMIFSIRDDAGLPTSISDVVGNNIARVADFVVQRALDNPGAYVKNTLTGLISDEFSTDFVSVVLGDAVNKGNIFVPRWIQFESANGDHTIKIWFSREDFASQYDEYEIIVIPRIPNVAAYTTLFTVAELNTLISTADEQYMLNRVIEVTTGAPATAIQKYSFSWVSRLNPANTQEVPFTYVIYGNGFDLSAIKEATIKTLLASTGGVDTIWRQVFPSLFGDNLYVIVPHWDKNSIPNASPASAFYSPVFKDGDNLEYGKLAYGTVNTSFLVTNARGVMSTYRGLVFTVYPDPDNVSGAIPFNDSYIDYFNVSSQSLDFSRLQPRTQDLIRVLDRLFVSAEALGPNSTLETGVSRRTVLGKLYAVANTDDGNSFMVMSKSDVVNL